MDRDDRSEENEHGKGRLVNNDFGKKYYPR